MSKSDYVLVVDDEALCALVELALGDEGYEVAGCTDPADALRLVAERRPGLILLDLRMPAMDGMRKSSISGDAERHRSDRRLQRTPSRRGARCSPWRGRVGQ